MTDLNRSQMMIASSLEGMIVVDAGPGTGKTHTIVERYLNILKVPETDPREIILMTFTNNAASEMKERLEERITDMDGIFIQTSTFDSFCLEVVLDDPESVADFFGVKERLTRNARLVQNETMNFDHFSDVYTRFVKKNGHRYGDAPALTSSSVKGLYDLIGKLMSRGIMPLPDYDWFGGDNDILKGNVHETLRRLKEKSKDAAFQKKVMKDLEGKGLSAIIGDEGITDDLLEKVANDDRRYLIWLIHDVYHEYIRSSISDNRLTFALTSLFALASLYSGTSRKRFSYRYVMIDEFQDTNELQLKIAMLILKEPNLCVVGDWKQGIYGFRNASIENITEFGRKLKKIKEFLNRDRKRIDFQIPEVVTYPLTINYRSSQMIIDTAFSALTIKGRKDEEFDPELGSKITELDAARKEIKKNTAVELMRTDSIENEVFAVLCQIQRYVTDPKYMICEDGKERRPEYKDIAVLCRNSRMCRLIKEKAEELGVPAFLQGDVEIMSTREGKLALAWLRYVNNRYDESGLTTILVDKGYTMSEIETILKSREAPDDMVSKRRILVKKKRRLNDLLTTVFSYHGLNNDITQAIISVLSSAHKESLLTISDLIRLIEEDIRRSTIYPVDPVLGSEAVTIQTIHKSKGLEYPIVILAGLNRSSFPVIPRDDSEFKFNDLYGIRSVYEYRRSGEYHSLTRSWKWYFLKNLYDTDYNEERRLFFVALSRAKQYISMIASKPSPFMNAFGENNICEADLSFRPVERTVLERSKERPVIGEYSKRRMNVSVHDVMGMQTTQGRGDEIGKGIDHGIKVHEAAQLLALGITPKEETEETEEIMRILNSLKGADILTEIDCTLPIGNVTIRGIMDMVAVFPDRAEVHDYKTDTDESNFERYRIQLSIYVHAVSSFLKRRTEGFVDYVLMKKMKKIEPLTLDQIAELVDDMRI